MDSRKKAQKAHKKQIAHGVFLPRRTSAWSAAFSLQYIHFATFVLLNAADPSPRQQMILLKLDDVVAGCPAFSTPVSRRWQRIAADLITEYLQSKNVVFMTPSEYLLTQPK